MRTTANVYRSSINKYKVVSNIVYQNKEWELQNMAYSDNKEFLNHIILSRHEQMS